MNMPLLEFKELYLNGYSTADFQNNIVWSNSGNYLDNEKNRIEPT